MPASVPVTAQGIARCRIVVVADPMLDHYWHGEVDRLSGEAQAGVYYCPHHPSEGPEALAAGLSLPEARAETPARCGPRPRHRPQAISPLRRQGERPRLGSRRIRVGESRANFNEGIPLAVLDAVPVRHLRQERCLRHGPHRGSTHGPQLGRQATRAVLRAWPFDHRHRAAHKRRRMKMRCRSPFMRGSR